MPTLKERIEDAKPYVLPALSGMIVLAVAGWVAWIQFGPKRPEKPPAAPAALTPEQQARIEQQKSFANDVVHLEKAYQDALAAGANAVALESLLNRAIDRQREVLRLEPRPGGPAADKLARLEATRGDLRARKAAAESRALEQAAEEEAARGQPSAQGEKLREALRLQRVANQSAHDPDLADLARELRLASLLEEATIGPLRAVVSEAKARAELAVRAEDWAAAMQAYQQARAAQAEFTAKSEENRAANLAALEQLDGEIASLRAADLASRVAATVRAAEAALAAGRGAEAAALFTTAQRQQREVNAQYPKSRFASTGKLAELGLQREAALAAEPLARLAALEREVTAQLRRGEAAAGENVAEAAALAARIAAEFPGNRGLDPALRRRLEYLGLRRADLPAIHEQVHGALAAIPGRTGPRMLRTEVTQDLYARVMNLNPSRQQGRGLPVDSVSWHDAREFCERLSWLLATTVRLPREDEFRAAWGTGPSGQEWSRENSANRSREVGRTPANPAGFHDLAGNLAEWLDSPNPAGGTVPVAGGSFTDPKSSFAELPVALSDPRARARHVGFRIVVEPPAPSP